MSILIGAYCQNHYWVWVRGKLNPNWIARTARIANYQLDRRFLRKSGFRVQIVDDMMLSLTWICPVAGYRFECYAHSGQILVQDALVEPGFKEVIYSKLRMYSVEDLAQDFKKIPDPLSNRKSWMPWEVLQNGV